MALLFSQLDDAHSTEFRKSQSPIKDCTGSVKRKERENSVL